MENQTFRHARRWATSTSGTLTLTNSTVPGEELIVIDWLICSGVADATPTAFVVAISGIELARWRPETASAATYREFDFAGAGYPSWSVSDTDAAPKATNTPITLTGPASSSVITCGYHFARAADVRSGV